jgi:cell division protein FtsB
MPRKEKNGFSFPKKLLVTGLTFLSLVLIIASFFGKQGWIEIYKTKNNKESLQQEVDRLTKKRNQLMRDIWELENNPKAVELKAREKLWLMDPEEIVIVKE